MAWMQMTAAGAYEQPGGRKRSCSETALGTMNPQRCLEAIIGYVHHIDERLRTPSTGSLAEWSSFDRLWRSSLN